MDELRALVLAGAPAAADAEHRYERFAAAAQQAALDASSLPPDAGPVLRCAIAKAPYLAALLTRDPLRLARVAADPCLHREKDKRVAASELSERLRGITDADALRAGLRSYRADELLRLGYRELELRVPFEVGRELAHLADVCLDAAIDFHRAVLDAKWGPALDSQGQLVPFAVIGMGKLGGLELNFSSDIDLIYAYSTDDGASDDPSLHEYFSQLAREVTASLGEVTADGVVFRVDLRLRPEGSRGAIVNSLPSMERYYETFGRPWERQAWLKARPCAGSHELGEEILDMLRPFIYPRSSNPAIIEEVHSLNQRIKTELVPGGVDTGFDVKNGVGGIREVEFFVQALQLVHAGQMPAIRSRNTVTALDQLLVSGLVSAGEHSDLRGAYRFLRHVEHVLQLESGRQTQRLPTHEQALELLARRLGEDNADSLRETLASHTVKVAKAFASLGEDNHARPTAIDELLSGDSDADRERALLAELGFRDPVRAQSELERARTFSASPLAGAAIGAAARVAPIILAEIARSAAPDQALAHLVELVQRSRSWALIWRLMDAHPELARLVATLFATSDFLSKLFISNPNLNDVLLEAGQTASVVDKGGLRTMSQTDSEQSDEAEWNALAEFKSAQVLRIGLADLSGDLDAEQICQELSKVADVCLERALDLVTVGLESRHGTARAADGTPSTLAVFAMGKLGGQEIGYASDLDVVFVYSDDGASDGPRPIDNVVYMTRVAQRLMGGLHAMHPGGRLYEVDTRLRPSGRRGLLVSSWSQWQRYHREEARLWEKQALTKLRYVAGDRRLGGLVEAEVSHFLFDPAPTAAQRKHIAEEIGQMRDKIEKELGARVHGYDIKTGSGGLIDIEFCAQYLQLAFGHQEPALRVRSTVAALTAAAEHGLADQEQLATLIDGYRFLRKLEHRMRIVHDRPTHRLPTEAHELELLARRAGYETGEALEAAYAQRTGAIRRCYAQVLGLA